MEIPKEVRAQIAAIRANGVEVDVEREGMLLVLELQGMTIKAVLDGSEQKVLKRRLYDVLESLKK